MCLNYWFFLFLFVWSDSSHGYYLISGVVHWIADPNFSFSSHRSSIWLHVKPDVLLTMSTITNAKYLKCISPSQHSSIKCVKILVKTVSLIWLLELCNLGFHESHIYNIAIYEQPYMVSHICNIWSRASAIRSYEILSTIVLEIAYDWLATKLSQESISYCMVCIDGGQCQPNHVLYSMNHHKLINLWGFNNVFLVTSMELSEKMLWRNVEFLIKCKWQLIIWNTFGSCWLKVDLNITLFSKDFSIFYMLHIWV